MAALSAAVRVIKDDLRATTGRGGSAPPVVVLELGCDAEALGVGVFRPNIKSMGELFATAESDADAGEGAATTYNLNTIQFA